MKKINKGILSIKQGKNSRVFRWIIAALFIILIILSAALIKFYFDVNRNTEKKSSSAVIEELSSENQIYSTFEDDNGKVGVVNDNDRVIIGADWDSVCIIDSDRFIVSKSIGGSEMMGIIDIDENIVSPFIFSDFDYVCKGALKGYVESENSFMLFDTSGELLNENVWDEIDYNGDKILLSRENDTFSAEISDDELVICSADMIREADGHLIYFKTDDTQFIASAGTEDITGIMDVSSQYLEALINQESESISELTEDQYYSALADNNVFNNCIINGISSCEISLKEDSGGAAYNFTVEADYDYRTDDTEINNIVSEISLNIVKNSEGRLILKSINKTEL